MDTKDLLNLENLRTFIFYEIGKLYNIEDRNLTALNGLLTAWFAEKTKEVREAHGIKDVDEDGDTFLHEAAATGCFELIQDLVAKGVKVNVSNKYGWTPLHRVASCGSLKGIQFLVENGADPKAITGRRLSVLDMAVEADCPECLKYLNGVIAKSNQQQSAPQEGLQRLEC